MGFFLLCVVFWLRIATAWCCSCLIKYTNKTMFLNSGQLLRLRHPHRRFGGSTTRYTVTCPSKCACSAGIRAQATASCLQYIMFRSKPGRESAPSRLLHGAGKERTRQVMMLCLHTNHYACVTHESAQISEDQPTPILLNEIPATFTA